MLSELWEFTRRLAGPLAIVWMCVGLVFLLLGSMSGAGFSFIIMVVFAIMVMMER